jgi:hypothetical protein
MLVVHVHARVRPGRVEDFLPEEYSPVFPDVGEGWASGPP